MPVTLLNSLYPQGQGLSRDVLDKDLGYAYPDDLDLRPSSDLHKHLVGMLIERATESRRFMKDRESVWRKLERNLTAYVPLSVAEKRVKQQDARKPVSIVIPLSFATLDTLLTYRMSLYMRDPLYGYQAVGPEDSLGSALLERMIQLQVKRNKIALSLYFQDRDSYVYGFGAVTPRWTVDYGLVPVQAPSFGLSPLGQLVEQEQQRLLVRDVTFEGNVVDNIDPYLYLPDPNVPIYEPQKGEYVGWIQRTNYFSLLNEERASQGDMFNVRYLNDSDARTSLLLHGNQSGKTPVDPARSPSQYGKPADVLWMNITLIPKFNRLGSSEYPEKWLFGLAGDSVIVYAKAQNLEHGKYPVAVSAPDADGHSLLASSRLEIVYGMQEFIDWSISSHITNVRKSLNDMWIVDPMLVNIADLQDPEPGKLIRTRRSAWGRGVEGGIKQFPVQDVTSQHVAQMPLFMDIINRVAGSTDILQGMVRQGGERRSALEARDARSSALSRLEKLANVSTLQSHYDLQLMLASHTQQFMSKEMKLRATGRLVDVLSYELGQDPNQALNVSPLDLRVNWDYMPGQNSLNSGEFAQSWQVAMQTAGSNQELMMNMDVTRLYIQWLRSIGIENAADFRRQTGTLPQMPTQVQPDEQVAGQVQAGNLVPLSEVSGVQ